MSNGRIEYMCPHCGWRFDALLAHGNVFGSGLVPVHAPGGYITGASCPGSNQHPRNPESDRRPLWKDMTPEKEESLTFREKPSDH